jgi:hypothetical protein
MTRTVCYESDGAASCILLDYLRKIGNKLGYNNHEDYYNLTQTLLHVHGGSYLFDKYR